jgi:hypothetical protein
MPINVAGKNNSQVIVVLNENHLPMKEPWSRVIRPKEAGQEMHRMENE